MSKNYMSIDQYGQTFHDLGENPLKSLKERLGSRKVSKMYRDRCDGSTIHVGYVIGQHWCTLYEVKPFEGSGP